MGAFLQNCEQWLAESYFFYELFALNDDEDLHSKECMNVDTIMSCVSYLYLRTHMIRNVAHMNRSGVCVQSQCRFSLEHMFGNERWNLLKM